MSSYAPANEAGDKPYVIEGRRWGKVVTFIVYALSASNARYVSGLRGTGEYVISVRRATPLDVETLEDFTD